MDVSEKDLQVVSDIFAKYLPEQEFEVFLFGSRINKTARSSSDLDTLIKGEHEVELSKIALIKEAFENSNLPYKVDVLDFHRIKPEFAKRILSKAYKLK